MSLVIILTRVHVFSMTSQIRFVEDATKMHPIQVMNATLDLNVTLLCQGRCASGGGGARVTRGNTKKWRG